VVRVVTLPGCSRESACWRFQASVAAGPIMAELARLGVSGTVGGIAGVLIGMGDT
jgi:hypothetical protein